MTNYYVYCIISNMSRLEEKITAVRSGDELFGVWSDLERTVPQDEAMRSAWAKAVEARTHTFLAARVGDIAVSSLFIKWSGPVDREKQFTEALADEFPGLEPIP